MTDLDKDIELSLSQLTHASICYDCAKSGGLCPWSSNFEAVPGWKIIKIKRRNKFKKLVPWVRVIYCPYFELEDRQRVLTSPYIKTHRMSAVSCQVESTKGIQRLKKG